MPVANPNDLATVRGLAPCRATATDATPRVFAEAGNAPSRCIGIGTASSLKVSFFDTPAAMEYQANGDTDYVTLVMHSGGARVWRDGEPAPAEPGAIGMFPFVAHRYRFEGRVRVMHAYLPFALVSTVFEDLFERDLKHEQLRIPMGTKDDRLSGAMLTVRGRVQADEPTNLILDSWALILSEILVLRFSGPADRRAPLSFGRIPGRSMARVIDYIEANIGQDLRLSRLASVAAMSVFHFARRFRETVGVSPHAYVLARRVRRAQAMVAGRGGVSLAQAAAACGFSSQAHLTTAFRRVVGLTPARYRQSC